MCSYLIISVLDALHRNAEDVLDGKHRTRLDNALAMNEPLSKAYYMKEQSNVPRLARMAATIMAHRTGILAWYDCHFSTAIVEGINNKIKVLKRNAYGFRDDDYFKLRLFALHDSSIQLNCG